MVWLHLLCIFLFVCMLYAFKLVVTVVYTLRVDGKLCWECDDEEHMVNRVGVAVILVEARGDSEEREK